MRVQQFIVDGLGHLSTLIADDSRGVAAVVDPRRDVDVYLAAARASDLRITHVIETHLHNDYVSGGRELAALTGATHVIGAGAELRYEHQAVRNGEAVEVGRLRFSALETPGHTPEHVSYAVADTSRADEPLLLFTGGSLLVGAVGRTDLLGAENAVPYARAMFRSLREVILPHEDFVAVYPTHGAGSLCSTGIASTPWSTVGYERRHNPMVRPNEVELFVSTLLGSQPAFPRYFARMRPLNQAGPALTGGRAPEPRPLSADEVKSAIAGGALVIDLRPPQAHTTAHVPGSLSIPAGSSFGTWLGWVVEPDRPLVFILDRPADWDDAARQSLRIGYEGSLTGHLAGGFRRWTETGGVTESAGRMTVDELARSVSPGGPDAPLVIDVRQAGEFASGHVPGSRHLTAGSLQDHLADLPRDRPIAVICASGYRSSVAASLLTAAGFSDVSWVADGLPAWKARGHAVERGADELPAGAGEPRGAEEPAALHRH
jgi:hydroxyacylglutathione hydrolase